LNPSAALSAGSAQRLNSLNVWNFRGATKR
jgi:hypothetical protein